MKKFLLGAFWCLVGLFSLLVFGSLFSLIGSSFLGEPADGRVPTNVELAEAKAGDLSPHGAIASIFSIFSSETRIRQDAYEKEIRGQLVLWSLPVSEVNSTKYELAIHTASQAGAVSTLCVINDPTDEDRQNAMTLSRGERVTCKGSIKGRTFMGGVEINPAIVVWD